MIRAMRSSWRAAFSNSSRLRVSISLAISVFMVSFFSASRPASLAWRTAWPSVNRVAPDFAIRICPIRASVFV